MNYLASSLNLGLVKSFVQWQSGLAGDELKFLSGEIATWNVIALGANVGQASLLVADQVRPLVQAGFASTGFGELTAGEDG